MWLACGMLIILLLSKVINLINSNNNDKGKNNVKVQASKLLTN